MLEPFPLGNNVLRLQSVLTPLTSVGLCLIFEGKHFDTMAVVLGTLTMCGGALASQLSREVALTEGGTENWYFFGTAWCF